MILTHVLCTLFVQEWVARGKTLFDMARSMQRDLIDDLPSQFETMVQTASRHADFDQFEFTNDRMVTRAGSPSPSRTSLTSLRS